eukprot:maker-scaffold175_size286436-snap-gene-1.51 protein:Tk09287 transcript:maker-scaffold175_size286436-snap-gene-1.51-mRNA-1 annotation:"FAM113A"
MADIFERDHILDLFQGKSILFLGDSIMRSIYKDLVFLLAPERFLCEKGERSFFGDTLFDLTEMTAGRNYREGRDFYLPAPHDLQLTFQFITRCFSDRMAEMIRDYPTTFGAYPDMVIINSALWDINRWGPLGIEEYRKNIQRLFDLLEHCLPSRSQVVWMTTPPISVDIRGGFLIEGLEFQQKSMRFNIMAANDYAGTMAASSGFDVIDMHYHFTHQIHRRSSDGIHWNPDAVRMQTNIVLTHLCLSRGLSLPKNWTRFSNPIDASMPQNVPLSIAQNLALAADDEMRDLLENPYPSSDSYSDRDERRIARPIYRRR